LKSLEEKVIENTKITLEKLSTIYKEDDEAIIEYTSLSEKYTNLNKRYNSIVRLGDIFSHSLEHLNDDIQHYTREKIINYMTQTRELKETYVHDLDKLKEEAEDSDRNYLVNKLKEELHTAHTRIKLVEIKNAFLSDLEIPLDKILKQYILNAINQNQDFTFAIIGINNFAKNKKIVKDTMTSEDFILSTYRFLETKFKSPNFIKYINHEVFYLMLPKTTVNSAIKLLEKVSSKRAVGKANVTLTCCITSIRTKDTSDSLIFRCEEVYKKAISLNTSQVIKV